MLPPGDFLPAFEHYRMMGELDRWVVRNALRRLGQGGRIKKLSVNVSGRRSRRGASPPLSQCSCASPRSTRPLW